MLTKRKKFRNRKKTVKKILFFLAVVLTVGVSVGYFIYLKLFPKISYISPLATNVPANTQNQEESDVTFMKSLLKEQGVEFASIKTEGTQYLIDLPDKSQVVLTSEKDLRSQISSLQFILSRLKMEGRRFSRLDLTFDKPVILFDK